MDRIHKLAILADAAKYDSSCASSGAKRDAQPGGIGHSTGAGICHSYTPDGRCVSLLKMRADGEHKGDVAGLRLTVALRALTVAENGRRSGGRWLLYFGA